MFSYKLREVFSKEDGPQRIHQPNTPDTQPNSFYSMDPMVAYHLRTSLSNAGHSQSAASLQKQHMVMGSRRAEEVPFDAQWSTSCGGLEDAESSQSSNFSRSWSHASSKSTIASRMAAAISQNPPLAQMSRVKPPEAKARKSREGPVPCVVPPPARMVIPQGQNRAEDLASESSVAQSESSLPESSFTDSSLGSVQPWGTTRATDSMWKGGKGQRERMIIPQGQNRADDLCSESSLAQSESSQPESSFTDSSLRSVQSWGTNKAADSMCKRGKGQKGQKGAWTTDDDAALSNNFNAKQRLVANTERFSKTQMCKFVDHGLCRKGPLCPFAHSEEERQVLPDFHHTQLCKDLFRKGFCHKTNCNFAHSKEELRASEGVYKTKLCRFWQLGSCRLGMRCRFAHSAVDVKAENRSTARKGSPSGSEMLFSSRPLQGMSTQSLNKSQAYSSQFDPDQYGECDTQLDHELGGIHHDQDYVDNGQVFFDSGKSSLDDVPRVLDLGAGHCNSSESSLDDFPRILDLGAGHSNSSESSLDDAPRIWDHGAGHGNSSLNDALEASDLWQPQTYCSNDKADLVSSPLERDKRKRIKNKPISEVSKQFQQPVPTILAYPMPKFSEGPVMFSNADFSDSDYENNTSLLTGSDENSPADVPSTCESSILVKNPRKLHATQKGKPDGGSGSSSKFGSISSIGSPSGYSKTRWADMMDEDGKGVTPRVDKNSQKD